MYGIKNAVMAKEHDPEADVTIYYADIRAFGKGFEEFYEMARTRFGVNFVKGRVGEVIEDSDTQNLWVEVEDINTAHLEQVEHDLLVISPGLQPPKGLDVIAKTLNLAQSGDGYLDIEDSFLAPVETPVEGVFTCGCADGPKDIPDSVTAGSAAAMRATIILSKAGDKK